MADDIKLTCKIEDVKRVGESGTYLISVRYKQGSKEWFKPWKFTPTRPVSMEQLEAQIATLNPWPEDQDFMKNVDEEQKREFEIHVKPPVKAEGVDEVAKTAEEFQPQVQDQQVTVPPGSVLP